MNRKAKITLTLSSITLILGVAAQFYTNHKIDRSLQSFPYHLKDQLTLHVTEKTSGFFHRELVFSLEDDKQQKTDIISTNLTALPFTIIAESQVPDPLIRELNKKLNITIDKNSISSKFSVVGDYLQSDIVTQFRDLANKPQDLQININYAAKTKSMEIQSQLSAFNYDAKTKFEGLTGQYVLIPTGDHQYDLAELEMNIKHADIYLLNGENTNIKLDKAYYRLNKSLIDQHYDLATHVTVQKAIISNKNKTSENDLTAVSEFAFSSKQTNVPNTFSVYNEFENFIAQNKTLPDALNLLTDILFNNDGAEAKIAAKVLSLPTHPEQNEFIKLQDAVLTFSSDNQDKTAVNSKIALNIKQITEEGKKQEKFNLKGLTIAQQFDRVNLIARLNLLQHYIAILKNPATMSDFPAKDDATFIEELKQAATNFNEKREATISIDALDYANTQLDTGIALEGIKMTHLEDQQQEKYGHTSSFSMKKLVHKEFGLQLSELEYQLPLRLSTRTTPSPLDLCYDKTYQLLCPFYLSEKSYKKWQDSFVKETMPTITNAEFKAHIDTFPNTQVYPIRANLTLGFNPQKTEMMYFNINHLLLNLMDLNVDLKLMFAKGIVDDTQKHTLLTSEKNAIWQMFYKFVKPNNQLAPYFIDEGENYSLHFVQQDRTQTINAQPMDEIMNKLNSMPSVEPHDERPPSLEQPVPELPAGEGSPSPVETQEQQPTAP